MQNQLIRACLVLIVALMAPDAPATPTSGYAYYVAGDPAAATPRAVQPGLMLLGGGDWPVPAFRWFVERAGHGHIVMLRASGTDDLQQDFLNEIGGAASVETLVFSDRAAASDPEVLKVLRHADGIFLGGGDQAKYVRFWKDTPVNELLDAHVKAGKPIGGTSAGLAILGAYSYGALDDGSLKSSEALQDPLGSGVTLVRDFLHMPYLGNVITDTHFAIRSRQGRLITFVGRLIKEEGNLQITGIGVDQTAGLCIDENGIGKVYARDAPGYAWLIRPLRGPEKIAHAPLTFRDVPIVGIGPDSVFDLKSFAVERPAFQIKVSVVDGKFDAASQKTLADVTPGDEANTD